MRSPWVDLLFLHGHVTPSGLTWLADAPPCGCKADPAKPVFAEVSQLPLPAQSEGARTCCA